MFDILQLFEDDEVSAFEFFHLFCKNGFNSNILKCSFTFTTLMGNGTVGTGTIGTGTLYLST